MFKTSRALTSQKKAFRIEKKKVYEEDMFDIVWQANGDDEGVAILVERKDLIELRDEINKFLK